MNKKNYDLVVNLTALTHQIKTTLEENELTLIEVKAIANKIIELHKEEYTVHKNVSYTVNSEEIEALGIKLAKMILRKE